MTHAPKSLAVTVLLVAIARSAAAAPSPEDRAAAEVLFRDAKSLMSTKSWSKACRKLEESQRLDPQGGTLLNLAVCHAREGRTASAWVEFQEAADIAKSAHRKDRIRLAQRELEKLDKELARLTIEVPKEARVAGLVLERDGVPVGEGGFGTAVPVDPGVPIALEARAPGYRNWTTELSVEPREQKTIVVPKLDKAPAPPPVPNTKPVPASKPHDDGKSQQTLGLVLGGAGLVAVGVGGYFGLRALSKKKATEDHCNGKLCDADGVALNDQAKSAATISNVAFGVGLLAVGAGAYLYFSADSGRPTEQPARAESTAIRLAPSIGPHSGAMLLYGRW
jgi:hypothetical protein